MRLFLALFFCTAGLIKAQETTLVGSIIDGLKKTNLDDVVITIESTPISTRFIVHGKFDLLIELQGTHVLKFEREGYTSKKIPVLFEGDILDLGQIILERDVVVEQFDNLITLTDTDLTKDSGSIENATGLLQATRDIFLKRAAFDFGQAFFRVRGYDAQNGQVLINGIPMNRFFDGRPQWNNFGGLNDVTRNQEFTNGLGASEYAFGGI